MAAPIFVPVLLLAAGMLAGWYLPGARDLFLGGLLVSVLLSLACFFLACRPSIRFAPLLIPLVLLGASRTSLRLHPVLPQHHLVHRVQDDPIYLEGVLLESPRNLHHGSRLLFRCVHVLEEGVARRATGRIDLFLNGHHPGLEAGDVLLVKARVRRVQEPGNPGVMRTRPRSFLRGVHLRGNVQTPAHVFRLGSAPGYGAWRALRGVRDRMAGFLQEAGDARTEGLLKVWLLGDRTSLPRDLRDDFRASGLAHLLALSGLHVGMVFLFSYGVWRVLLRRSLRLLVRGKVEPLAILCALPAVLFYVVLAGSPVTAVRAGLMAALVAGAAVLGRAPSVWNGLAAAALFILLGSPAALFSPSFLLSFITVGVLLIRYSGEPEDTGEENREVISRVDRVVRRLLRGARGILSVSFKASLAVTPLTAHFFQTVTPLAFAANLVVVPLACWVVLPLGMLAGALSMVWTPAGRAVLVLAEPAVALAARAASFFARIPGASIRTGTPTLLEMLCCYGVLVPLLLRGPRAWRHPLVLVCAAVFCLSVGSSVFLGRTAKDLKVTFLAVGNGDAALVEFPGGRRMLVDGGPAREGYFDAGERVVAPFLGAKRFRRVDTLVVSHGETDHYGGFAYLLERFRLSEVWIPHETGTEGEGYGSFLEDVNVRGVTLRRLCRGVSMPAIGGVKVDIVHPGCPVEAGGGSGPVWGVNDASVVFMLTYGSVRVLFSGDIETGAEADLVALGEPLDACVLKVPHHGSATSSTPAFLERVNPRVAVVSVGRDNRFGLPSDRVLERYRRLGVSLYVTSLDGAVEVRTDGQVLAVSSHLSGRKRAFDRGRQDDP